MIGNDGTFCLSEDRANLWKLHLPNIKNVWHEFSGQEDDHRSNTDIGLGKGNSSAGKH